MVKRAVVLFALLIAVPSGAGEPLTMRVSPAAAFEPALLTIRAIVETDADNRALEIVAQSPDFYRSSFIELDGASAQRLNIFQFRNLPSGMYDVTSVLVGASGERASITHRFHVAPAPGASR
jgi:hypothetical protein